MEQVVMSMDGKHTGVVVGHRRCQMAGCTGIGLIVKWDDGMRTIPCTKGLTQITENKWRIG